MRQLISQYLKLSLIKFYVVLVFLKYKLISKINFSYQLNFLHYFPLNQYQEILNSIMSYDHQPEHASEITQVERIAASTTAKKHFLQEQEKLLDQWGEKSLDLFKFTAEVFKKEYEIKSSELIENYGQKHEDLYAKCRKEFEAYCILNRKVQRKNDEIQNFAAFFNQKNTKKSFFSTWKQYSKYQSYLRSMQDRCWKQHQTKTLKNCLKGWNEIMMKSNRMKIKNEVLHKTEIQITRVQEEYERIIKTLEETLEKKLTQLKKQEEEHKLLHDKYENMYARRRVEGGGMTR